MNSLALDILLRKNGLSENEPPTEEIWKKLVCELDEQQVLLKTVLLSLNSQRKGSLIFLGKMLRSS